jgi:hypothetical protein
MPKIADCLAERDGFEPSVPTGWKIKNDLLTAYKVSCKLEFDPLHQGVLDSDLSSGRWAKLARVRAYNRRHGETVRATYPHIDTLAVIDKILPPE